jgi:carbonic anhydrase
MQCVEESRVGNRIWIGRNRSGGLLGGRKSRRRFLGTTIAAGVGGLLALNGPSFAFGSPAFAAEEPAGMAPDDALKALMEGNARFVAAKAAYPHQDVERRTLLAGGQQPIAVILSCSDSRVPPELVFDQGLGDLFTVRVAGNVADDAVIASIEYSVEHLGSTLVMVLGHEKCGAVTATLDAVKTGGDVPGHLPALVDPIRAAVIQANTQSGDVLDLAVIGNVGNVVGQLKASEPVLGELFAHEKIKIVGGRYDLDTGEVTIVA